MIRPIKCLSCALLMSLSVFLPAQDFDGEENRLDQSRFEYFRDIIVAEPEGPESWEAIVALRQLMDSTDINVVADSAELLAWYGMREEEIVEWVTAKAVHGRRWDRLNAIYTVGSFNEAGAPALQEFWDSIEYNVFNRRTGIHSERTRALWSIVNSLSAIPEIEMSTDVDEIFTLPAWMLFNLAQRGETPELRQRSRERLYTWVMEHDTVYDTLRSEAIHAWFALMEANREEPDFFAFLELLNRGVDREVWETILYEVSAYDDAAGMFLPRIERLSRHSNREIAVAATVARFRICGDKASQEAILELDQQAFNHYSSVITVKMMDIYGANPLFLELSLGLGNKMPARTTALLKSLVRRENGNRPINNPPEAVRKTLLSILNNRGVTESEVSFAGDLALRWQMTELLPSFSSIAEFHDDWKVQQVAMNFLTKLGGESSWETLDRLRLQENPHIRQTALRLMVEFPTKLEDAEPLSTAEALPSP